MSSPGPAPTDEGLLGNVASGYHLAWTARRPLLAVLLPVVAAMLLTSALLDVLLGHGRLVVVDGVAQPLGADRLAWAEAVTTGLFWLTGLVAGTGAIVRGTGPVEALRHGLAHLPAFAIGVVAAAGGVLVGLWAVAGLATGPTLLVLAIGVLAAGALAATRTLLIGIAWAVGGSGRTPAWTEAASFLIGGTAPLLFAYVWSRSGAGGVPYLGSLADAVLVLVLLAAQAGLAARPHSRAAAPDPDIAEAVPDPNSAEVVPRPHSKDPAQRRHLRLWPGLAMITAAVLIASGVLLANPYAAPTIRTHTGGPSGPRVVAWPAGGHPVIVTDAGVWFCDDDLCTDFTDVQGGPLTIDGFGTAAIAADGTVVKTAVTGGPERGGPFVHYARCVREGCREAWLPVRQSAADRLDPEAAVEVAGAAAPDGALWFFVAAPVRGGERGRYRFSFVRCPDVTCTAPRRHQVGILDRTPGDGYPNGRRARLTVGADGRPAASFWIGHSLYRYSCEPVTCAGPRETVGDAALPDAVREGAASFRAGELYHGAGSTLLAGDAAAQSGALTVAGSAVYVAAAVPTDPVGFHLTVGEPARYWRQTVWRCERLACVRTPLDVYEGDPRRELLAVAGDGRVLVVRDDRIVLLG